MRTHGRQPEYRLLEGTTPPILHREEHHDVRKLLAGRDCEHVSRRCGAGRPADDTGILNSQDLRHMVCRLSLGGGFDKISERAVAYHRRVTSERDLQRDLARVSVPARSHISRRRTANGE